MTRPPAAPSDASPVPAGWRQRLPEIAVLVLAAMVISLIATRRHVDPTDEGFYYANAWLAYSAGGATPVGALLMNFGHVIGWPFWFWDRPPILAFRLSSLVAWFAIHAWFFAVGVRALRLDLPRVVAPLLALASLAIFLIPQLSYQNLPYLFVLLAATLMLAARNDPTRARLFWVGVPVALALGIVTSTIFAVLAPLVALVLVVAWCRERPLPWIGCALGAVVALALLLAVFDWDAIRAWRSTMAFFTSEMDYSSSGRIVDRLLALLMFVAPGFALGAAAIGGGLLLRRRFDADRAILALAGVGILLLLARATATSCIITCDAVHIDWINAGVVAALTALALLLRRGSREWPVVAAMLLCGGTAMVYAVISNAPFHYNLKFAVPLFAGVWILLVADALRRDRAWSLALPAVAGAALWATALRILLLAHYGGEPPWQATEPMTGAAFRGLYATPARAAMFRTMQAEYDRHGCAALPFAAVDSLVLPYFLFERRPPFPHAWVGERVEVSRAIVQEMPRACVMMQDRVLPDTPKDAETMTGYLRLTGRDQVEIVPLGLNIFLVKFARSGPA